LNQEKLREFEPIFYPRSIAVVGASKDKLKYGTRYLESLINVGFKGKVYPVNPGGGEVCGLEAYPSLRDIPGPVDYVIVAIPAQFVLDLLDDCAAKGVKVVQFFTAGFSETGEEEGRRLEREMVKKAKEGGFRIIGPNCIGVYTPAHFMPYGPMEILGEAGPVAFISQSGGHAGNLLQEGLMRGIHFSKVVSFGNGCDLNSVDYLEYLAVDPETKIVGAYLEGVKDGRRFLHLAREISKTKPMIVWKGGKTEAGAEAAASHTGALAISDVIWSAVLRQAGVIKVESLEELADTLLTFQHFPPFLGDNVAIIAGLAGGGGGDSVYSTDACTSVGLNVPPFTEETRSSLKPILPAAGSILRNPLDMGGVGGTLEILERTMEIVVSDPRINIVIVNEHIDFLLRFLSKERLDGVNDILIRFRRSQGKPIVVVSRPGLAGAERIAVERKLSDAQVTIYPSLDRAAKAIANMNWYFRFHREVAMPQGSP